MHALSRFISQALTARKMTPAEFARASGLSDQLVSQLLNAKAERMASMPKQRTIEGIARACNVPESYVVGIAIEAMGYDLGQARDTVDLSSLDDEVLLAEIGARLAARREDVRNDERSAPTSRGSVTAIRHPSEMALAPEVPDDIAASDGHRGHGRTQAERDRQDEETQG